MTADATTDILELAREKVLGRGEGLDHAETLAVLRLDDDRIDELLALAHEVRLKWCGEEVEVEGIISLKTGGCPEDCHFCSQSGLFESPVRAVQLDIAELVEAAKQTQKSGATAFCIVAAVKGPDERLMVQLEEAVAAVYAEVDIHVSVSVGILTREQVERLKAAGVKRYNHNLESARSFFPRVATTHTWDERHRTLEMIRDADIEVCTGGILGMGETFAQRAEFAVQLAAFAPEEVPINFLDPRPGTPFANRPLIDAAEALKATAMLRLAMPKATLRFGGGRELTLGDLGVEKGLQGGANALIVGNYLTTLGRPMEKDVDMLEGLRIPIKAVGQVI